MTLTEQTFRSQLLTRRTYNRPLNDEGSVFETWEQTVDRVIQHQRWLWERAQGRPLSMLQGEELGKLKVLMLERKALVSGRTLWLGGTDIAKTREASQFNCSFGKVETVFDVVDAYWLLLQGCGVGFEPITGQLHGFTAPVEIVVIRSNGHTTKGREDNLETLQDGVWTISVGDSAEAWSKAAGKLLAMSKPVKKLVLDFSEVRGAGVRLKGYGWISSGDETIHKAFHAIAEIRNKRVGRQLTRIDILDVMNWLASTLSSRRAAEIALVPYGDREAEAFAQAKKDHWIDNPQRSQSNNSLVFYSKPSKYALRGIFQQMIASGGSEPGFINGEAALKRAEWFKGCNPCAEILLGHKSFCNLVEVDLSKFVNDTGGLHDAIWLIARANYRQTCVDLRDGILSPAWHELNGFLRLCGVGLTGIVKWMDANGYNNEMAGYELKYLRTEAQRAANSMADDLGLPRPRAVTTVKPSGTLGKVMDTTEGAHRPLGKYIFNNVNFSKHDPLIPVLRKHGYMMFENPYDSTGMVVTLPVSYEGVKFTEVNGLEINTESAVEQLERYKMLMDNYVDHNCSITVSYDPSEVDDIVDWLDTNWDHFVGVSWLFRADPTKKAHELGYPYLPQEVVTKEEFEDYISWLTPVNLDEAHSLDLVDDGGCSTGACPVR